MQTDRPVYRFLEEWAQTANAIDLSAEHTLKAEITLVRAYTDPDRHYHTHNHIARALNVANRIIDQLNLSSAHWRVIALALFFHDAGLTEEKSADLARECLPTYGRLNRVCECILATKDHDVSKALGFGYECGAVVVDSDLEILAADEDEFDEYEHRVRQEYSGVSDAIFYPARRKVMEGFLAREQMYTTPYGYHNFESRARANIRRSFGSRDWE